eukprot:3789145-Karenia_brevis.AAC.1
MVVVRPSRVYSGGLEDHIGWTCGWRMCGWRGGWKWRWSQKLGLSLVMALGEWYRCWEQGTE